MQLTHIKHSYESLPPRVSAPGLPSVTPRVSAQPSARGFTGPSSCDALAPTAAVRLCCCGATQDECQYDAGYCDLHEFV